VIFPDIENDFYSAAMARLSRAMREAHYELVLAVSHDDAGIEAQHVRSLREARVAGVIIAPSTHLNASHRPIAGTAAGGPAAALPSAAGRTGGRRRRTRWVSRGVWHTWQAVAIGASRMSAARWR
jgi:hypothetical protein